MSRKKLFITLCPSARGDGVCRIGAASQQAGQPKANQSEAKGFHLNKGPHMSPEVPLPQNLLFPSPSADQTQVPEFSAWKDCWPQPAFSITLLLRALCAGGAASTKESDPCFS